MSKAKDEILYRAVLARDPRFDGRFFVAVKTTGIYCRPICPAKPKRENIEFYLSALAAEKAGYRPCMRCRPEAAPLSPAWYGKSATVQRALRAILERGIEESEDRFAERFGVSARHLRRLFIDEVGRTPMQIYQEQRLGLARKLLIESQLPVTEIAYASGFASLRRFNEAFKTRFKRAPSEVRRKRFGSSVTVNEAVSETTLWLSYRPPFRFAAILRYLKRHELAGVEEISETHYRRYYRVGSQVGCVKVEDAPEKSALKVTFDLIEHDSFYQFVQNIRRLFDLDADPLLISTRFENSKGLHRLDRKFPGGRSPGAWDPFETAISIVLGQLVSTQQACRLAAQLTALHGEPATREGREIRFFPTPEVLAGADLKKLGTTQKRKETIRILSRKIAFGELSLSPHQDIARVKEQLLEIPGVGPWTVEYIAMRSLSDPDSFPHSDLILKRMTEQDPLYRIVDVSPWRSYAAYLLWEFSSHEK